MNFGVIFTYKFNPFFIVYYICLLYLFLFLLLLNERKTTVKEVRFGARVCGSGDTSRSAHNQPQEQLEQLHEINLIFFSKSMNFNLII